MKEGTMPITKPKFSDSIIKLYAAAGVTPGHTIPLDKIDAGLAKMDLSIQQRMTMKSTLHRLGVIAR
jgi:hypothetical protein